VKPLSQTPAALALGLWAALAAGCSGVDLPPRPRNLLLVTIDTLRADRLGCYGHGEAQTPWIDGLARRGLRFTAATTVVPLTLPAHASLMTGAFPPHHGVRDNGGFYLEEEHVTLAEVLRDRGFRTGGFVGAFVLDSRWGIAQGFDHFFDDFDLTRFEDAPGMDAIQRPGGPVVDQALDWLGRDQERPFFAWVHLYDPHTPYEAPEPFRSRFPATLTGAYDAEIAATDAQVGRLLSALEADGRLRDTLVVVVADHGEMLGDHGEPTHGFFVYQPAVAIPLILAGPGIPAGEVTAPVRIVDVLPTVAARLGAAAPAAVQGVDLLPLARGQELSLPAYSESYFPRYHFGWSELTAVRDGRYKLIRAPRRELYDLADDPREERDLAEHLPAEADRLERTLRRLLQEVSSPTAPGGPRVVDEETRARLEALGYLGGSRSHADDGASRGDPKDKIGLYVRLKEASAAAAAGDLDTARERVRAALALDGEIVEGHLLLGNFEQQAERFEEAAAAYRAALARDPEHPEALYALAEAYKQLGRLEDARTGFERARSLDPRNGKVLWQLADVHQRRGRHGEAEALLLEALALDLDRPRFLVKLGECYFEMGRLADAEARLREALDANPGVLHAHFSLGLVLEEQGRRPEAMAAYRAEVARNPEAYRASFNLAKLLLQGGRSREAAEHFRRAVEIRPRFGTGHLYLAKALLDLGELAAAEDAALRGLRNQPEPRLAPLGHYVLADVYNRLGKREEAVRQEAAARRLEAELARSAAGA
jgi:arylsulfatase A-like enzyme/predicted Zn-dependent protease